MDQVRAIAKVIWEQRFWVLSVLGVLIGVVCWSMATSDLDSQFATRNSAINSAFTTVNGIAGEQIHPNPAVVEEDKKQVTVQREAVYQVWKDLYERQNDVLKWPEALGPEFIDYISDLKFGDPIKLTMRGFYQNYIEKRFDGLLEIVDAQKIEGQGGMGRGGYGGESRGRGGEGMMPMPGEGADDDYLVQWLDQDQVRQKLYFGAKPTAVQIWVTQEDLWVYEALLNVIARTNAAKKATRPDNTAIRVIANLEVGAAAAAALAQSGTIYMPAAPAGGGGEMGGYGRGGEYGGDMGRGGEYGGGEMGGYGRGGEYGGEFGGEMGYGRGGGEEGASDAVLLANRYLDESGAPTTSTDLASAGTPEFRQLPIRMMLLMDQRWLPQLLVECANSPLPVEVKQVRINPSQATDGIGTGPAAGSTSRIMQDNPDPSMAEIEIKGSVYIYKEPNETVIGNSGDGASQPADATTAMQ